MSFLLCCPQCGERDVYEFRWGGESVRRPAPGSPPSVWAEYLYCRFLYNPILLYAVNKAMACVPYVITELKLDETSVTEQHWSVRQAAMRQYIKYPTQVSAGIQEDQR